ncbi:MAG: NADH-quinone oxidoreductase subunit L [Endomicrobiia bacterium]
MEKLIPLVIWIPFFGAFIILLLKKFEWKKYLSAGLIFISFAIMTVFISRILLGATLFSRNLFFLVDSYSLIVAITSSLVGFLIVLYSFGYMKGCERQDEYYFFVTLFIGSMLGLVFSADLVLMYIFWEITSICSWQLISFYRKRQHLFAGNKAFLVTFIGSAMMLLGISMIFVEHNTSNLFSLRGKQISELAMILIFCGMLAKSAQIPFHTWLPDAGVAPTPVTALLHAAVLVKIGVYSFGRIFVFTFFITRNFQQLVMWISVITNLVTGMFAYVEKDIKRILAYSTISQIGYIFLGFVSSFKIGVVGAIFYIVSHAIAKAGLFLTAGIVEHNVHERDITKLGGLRHTMPITSISFLLCGLSVVGFPLFGGFFAKIFVINGIVQQGNILIALGTILGAGITLLYIMRVYNQVFLGDKKYEISEQTGGMVFVVSLLSIISVLIGLFPKIVLKFIRI